MIRILTLLFCLLGVQAAVPAAAQPRPMLLASVFQNHAVLQRDRPIRLWGRAFPGEAVTVRFAGATASARADRGGQWAVTLPARPAGGPFQLVVSSARGGRQTVDDVLVGDVWLCSGQSNMEYEVRNALNSSGEIAGSADERMRLFTVERQTSLTAMEEFGTPGRWQVASPASVGTFSAACYFTGRELRARYGVPVGLIDASWGGTAIDAWRSEAAIERGGGAADRLAVFRAYRRDPAEGNRLWGALWEEWWRSRSGDAKGAKPWREGPAAAGWKPVPRLSNWESWGEPSLAAFNGMMWYRTTVRLTPEQARQAASLDIGWADDLDQTWVNGVSVGNTYGPNTIRAYQVAPGTLKAGENSIVVNVLDTYGAGGLSGPEELRRITFSDGSTAALSGQWQYRPAPAAIGWPPRAPWETVAGLSTIYNGMVAPLGQYGLRGVAWYQGESDAGPSRGYAAKLLSMMADWRGQFGQELPFLIVQLAGWGPPSAVPQESGFATVRDEQRRAAAADPKAALAVAIDLGDRRDIHPANKQDVGLRLARAARSVAYGEAVPPSGPEGSRARRTADGIVVDFTNVEGELLTYSAGGATGFELCGGEQASCRFVEARAVGNEVRIADAAGPANRVRFCWGDSPVCNLYDRSGLPAGPFELEVR